jgi:PAS domain S-box-containing protein
MASTSTEISIERMQEQLSELVSVAPIAIYRRAHDTHLTTYHISHAIEEMTGYPAQSFLMGMGQHFIDIVHDDDKSALINSIDIAVKENQTWKIEYRVLTTNATIIWLSEQGKAHYNSDGKADYLDGFIIDISEKKEIELSLKLAKEEAERANAIKSLFLANMSHEIRTPMNAILGFSELLSYQDLEEKQKRYAQTITDNSKNLLLLIDDILDLSKIEAGKLELVLQAYPLESLATRLHNLFELHLEKKSLLFTIKGEDTLNLTINIDANRLEQIFINLLGNAIKFNNSGEITLSLHHEVIDNNYINLHLSLSDTGIGIADEDKKSIFNYFEQQTNHDYEKYRGHGLGLAITQQLTKLLGGTIRIEDNQPKGSLFKIILQNIEISSATITKEETTPLVVETSKKNILIVDDIEKNRHLIKELLITSKMDVLEASNGKEAITIAKQEKPDLILMDMQMPIMGGKEAMLTLKATAETQHIPIIAVTGDLVKQSYTDIGFDAFVSKPIKFRSLLNLIEEFTQ